MSSTDAGASPVERGVGRPEPERAKVGDVVACEVTQPFPQTLRLTLDSQTAAEHFNALPPAERRAWRLERLIGPSPAEYTGVRCMCVLTGCRAGPGCPHYCDHCKAHIAHASKTPNVAGKAPPSGGRP